ncbi:ThiF family adenylyltransferase [Microbacterium horticulturae]|uniref:ThiF family adenylyltransferase n=1 Tax=Microbacterium horticulturae TaxID=3028316 RepID=A0ABY8C3E1_9MICO|nr:ThiF family adenylyltransferase [Microbacterium sp. KACC 23027]WEG09735.1 ThiF family adenylyltransferase [Microbacterium sp. KACC 23027]
MLPPLVEPVIALSDAEQMRTARHQRLAGFGPDGQRRLAAARVGVIGAGGLGSPAILALSAAGVGELVVFDDDDVDASNLQRQVIHRRQDIGRPKTDSAERVAAERSETRVRPVRTRLTHDNAAELLDGVDLVLDGTDSFDSREIVAVACERLDVPVVWGTVQEFAGLVTVFWSAPPAPAEPVRLRDLYPSGSEAPACSAVGVLGPVCLQVGALMATEAIKLITGIGRPLLGRVALIDALAGTQREAPLRATRASDAAPAVSAPLTEVDEPGETDVVIDVREDAEVVTGMLPGARHVPLRALLGDATGVAGSLGGQPAVLVCQVGVRARTAAYALKAAGAHVTVLRGGMDGWNARRKEHA